MTEASNDNATQTNALFWLIDIITTLPIELSRFLGMHPSQIYHNILVGLPLCKLGT